MTASQDTDHVNRLLATLPAKGKQRFLASCDRINLDFGEVLWECGERIRYVYFPIDGFISLITALDDKARLEVGIVGNEGMLGVPLILGVDTSLQHALVQGSGAALRMGVAAFRQHCAHNPALRQGLDRYIYVMLSQLAQTAACTHYHRLEARLARWLLMSRDRAHSNQFQITQEFLSYMLGVRRAGITVAASALQERGLIKYSRGQIVIRNGAGLEKASCRCYGRGIEMYDSAMGAHRG